MSRISIISCFTAATIGLASLAAYHRVDGPFEMPADTAGLMRDVGRDCPASRTESQQNICLLEIRRWQEDGLPIILHGTSFMTDAKWKACNPMPDNNQNPSMEVINRDLKRCADALRLDWGRRSTAYEVVQTLWRATNNTERDLRP